MEATGLKTGGEVEHDHLVKNYSASAQTCQKKLRNQKLHFKFKLKRMFARQHLRAPKACAWTTCDSSVYLHPILKLATIECYRRRQRVAGRQKQELHAQRRARTDRKKTKNQNPSTNLRDGSVRTVSSMIVQCDRCSYFQSNRALRTCYNGHNIHDVSTAIAKYPARVLS